MTNMTIADTAPRTIPFGLGWLGRFTSRARTRRDDRFTPVADLPPYLLYDIGVPPDRLNQVQRHHW
jgi:hypothetical protein